MLLLFIVMKTIHQMFPKRFRKHMLQILEVLLAFEGIPSRLLKEKRLISQFVTDIVLSTMCCEMSRAQKSESSVKQYDLTEV